jgi:hypothetical protein
MEARLNCPQTYIFFLTTHIWNNLKRKILPPTPPPPTPPTPPTPAGGGEIYTSIYFGVPILRKTMLFTTNYRVFLNK